MSSSRSPESPSPLHVRWLLQLRWLAIACFLTLMLVSEWLYNWNISVGALAAVLGAAVASNLGLRAWLRRSGRLEAPLIAGVLGLDILVLTALLALSNGPLNPFTSLYVIHISVAAMALPSHWTAMLVTLAIAAYGGLFMVAPQHHMAHDEAALRLHLAAMWIAFAFTAPFLALSLNLVRGALRTYEEKLRTAHRKALHDQKLVSLATLAAGAAHELSTPLGTIAVVARELERHLGDDADAADDARLIRAEVDRCAAILRQLAADAGEGTGEAPAPLPLSALLAQTCHKLPVTLDLPPDIAEARLTVPRDLVARALRGLVKNAVQASGDVRVTASRTANDRVVVEVVDRGPGIDPAILARIGEPFFSTRAQGEGMGLGVFFAREVMARLGGAVSLTSTPGAGTTARIHFPPEEPR